MPTPAPASHVPTIVGAAGLDTSTAMSPSLLFKFAKQRYTYSPASPGEMLWTVVRPAPRSVVVNSDTLPLSMSVRSATWMPTPEPSLTMYANSPMMAESRHG